MTRCLIVRYDGCREVAELDDVQAMAEAIGADYLDFVTIREHGLILGVDDIGLYRKLPVNATATAFLMATGRPLSMPLVGDVIVFGLGGGGETLDAPADLLIAAVD